MTIGEAPPAPPKGLSVRDAAERLIRDGPNVLPTPAPRSPWKQLGAQLFHFFALMLWAAGGLAIVAGMPQLGIAIFVVVVINAAFSYAQERRADRAAERLRDLLPRRATVVRDGAPLEIDAIDLVVDDVVVLADGDRVSADMVVVVADGFTVDSSMLTGESVPAAAEPGSTLFAGTFAVEGQATAIVTAIGSATRLAGIAQLSVGGRRSVTPLASQLHRVVKIISETSVLCGLLFFGVGLALGEPARNGFLFAIGVTVALVPEGLLPTVTLTLAVGAQRMAEHHALVRHLEAVETLGATTFICIDKTGTLTQNRMVVVEVWTPLGGVRVDGLGYGPQASIEGDVAARQSARTLAAAAVRCSTGSVEQVDGAWIARGDPMEAALDAVARRLDTDGAAPDQEVDQDRPILLRFPFDPRRRRMSVVTADAVYAKGAPEGILPRCAVDAVQAERHQEAVRGLTERGLRVIAVATRAFSDGDQSAPDVVSVDAYESDLQLLGFVGLQDPPRQGVAQSIATCRRAGIRVAMITGDHPATAKAIADAVGLRSADAPVVEGRELPSDLAELGALVDHDGIVVSRASPEDKLHIAQALRQRGHVVAMTGDGVNDGPALHEAAVGVAMGSSGTDVARESADLVLLDDDFATIVTAVEHGRSAFANIRRFITYHLTDNVAELTPFVVWALSGGRFPLAIGVLQVLFLDIGTDLLPALALGAEPPAAHVLDHDPVRGNLLERSMMFRVFAVLGPTEAVVEMFAFLVALEAGGWRPGDPFPTGHALYAASGAAFAAVVLGQAANAFACRSETSWAGSRKLPSNRLLVQAVGLELGALAGFLWIGPVARLLHQAPPPLAGWIAAAAAVPAVIGVDAIHKAMRERRRHRVPLAPAAACRSSRE